MSEEVIDPLTGDPAEFRVIQPYQALKTYECPGCNQEIFPKTGHIVVVPHQDPDARRHWHKSCWSRVTPVV